MGEKAKAVLAFRRERRAQLKSGQQQSESPQRCEPPITDEEEPAMGRYADKLKAHIKEFRPNLYKELKAENRVDKFCRDREQEVLEQKERMTKRGMHDWEADEIILRDLLHL